MRHSSPRRIPAGIAIVITLLLATTLSIVWSPLMGASGDPLWIASNGQPAGTDAPAGEPGKTGEAGAPGPVVVGSEDSTPQEETPAIPPAANTPSGAVAPPTGGATQKPPATGAGTGTATGVCTVQQGDTLWLVAQRYGTTVDALRTASGLSGDTIYAGQMLRLPGGAGAIASRGSTGTSLTPARFVCGDGVVRHKVAQSDTLSQIAAKYGTTVEAIKDGNNLISELIMINQSLFLRPGSTAPASVSVTAGPHGSGGAEMLDWSQARWLFGVEYTATLRDPATGREFGVKRLGGSNHADIEPLTAADTAAAKAMGGGSWTWNPKPVLVIVGGRTLAASMNFMPHQLDTISGNGMEGHLCLHFRHSTTHVDNLERADHQAAVLKAAGLTGVSLPPGM